MLEHITNAVRQYDLGKYVSAVRFDKDMHHGDFYLYLGLRDVPEGRIPDVVERTLLQLPYFARPVSGEFFTDGQIRNSTRSAVALDTNERSLPYVGPPTEDEDLFTLPPEEEASSTDPERTVIGFDQLMYWLAAAGAGSWNAFRVACSEIGLASNGPEARSILRRLVLLGHVEPSADRSRWSAAPPLIVQQDFESRLDSFFLCGARDAHLLRALAEMIGEQNFRAQSQGTGPQFIGLRADGNMIKLIALRFGSSDMGGLRYAGNSARLLADALPTIEGWMQVLPVIPEFRPYRYQMKRFNGYGFVDCIFAHASGLYEVSPMSEGHDHTKGPVFSLLYDSSSQRWMRGDWYGLRYLAMWLDGFRPKLRFYASTGQLGIPAGSRWPEIYERSLVLASGRLPRSHGQWLIYESLSQDLVQTLRSKLQFDLE